MVTVYGISSCDACRKARKYLSDHGIEHSFHDVRQDGLDIQMLERWGDRIEWQKLLNRRSLSWRKLSSADRNHMTRNKAFASILQMPTLLKRPVIESPAYIAVGFSEKRFSDFLKKIA